jgi:hypothetical protein
MTSGLAKRLQEPGASGVYRVRDAGQLLQAAGAGSVQLARIGLSGCRDKQALMERVARALEFPDWFGGNWDALEDCLGDLSWRAPAPQVLLFEGHELLPREDVAVLLDILGSSAEYWAGRGRPFLSVFCDPADRLALPELRA